MVILPIVYPQRQVTGAINYPVVQGFLKGDLHGSSSLSGSLANSCITQQAIPLFKNMSSKMDTSMPKSLMSSLYLKKKKKRDFPGGPVTKTPSSNAGDPGLIPGQGARSPTKT